MDNPLDKHVKGVHTFSLRKMEAHIKAEVLRHSFAVYRHRATGDYTVAPLGLESEFYTNVHVALPSSGIDVKEGIRLWDTA